MSHPSRVALLAIAMTAALSACNPAPNGVAGSPPTPAPSAAGNASTKPITAAQLAAAKPVASCALDSVDNVLGTSWTVKKSAPSALGGWVSSSLKQAPASFTLVLRNDQAFGFPATTGIARPDVAQALASPGLRNAGFGLTADFNEVPAGVYQVVGLVPNGADIELCSFERQITVTP